MVRKIFLWVFSFMLAASPVLADSQGSATGGTSATQSTAAGCRYNSSAPTLTNGQQVMLQCDVNGALLTSGGGGGGGGAVFGPNAVGAAASHPPVIVGGTADATATGTVQVQKVDSSGNAYTSTTVSSSVLPTNAAQESGGNLASIATNTATVAGAVGSPIPAGTAVIGYTTPDPCSQFSKSGGVINLTASGQIITGTAAKKTYICSIHFVSATAQNIALVEGTGSTCATNIFGLAGGTTAAAGWNLSANGGMTLGNGLGTVISPSADSNATAANVCLLLSSTGQTSGQIAYVQQ